MRLIWLIALAACGDEFDAPDDCQAGQVHVVHGDVDATAVLGNLSFVNVFGTNAVGTLDIGDIGGNGGGDRVLVQFDKLMAHGETVSARGAVRLTAHGLDVGNCETGSFSGQLRQDDDGEGWRWHLVQLHAAPYCTGAAVAASLSGCFRKTN